MFTLSTAGNALNFFLVEDITAKTPSGAGSVVGIDGTIPGPSTIGGTVHSGAAVSIASLTSGLASCPANGAINLSGCGPDEVAYIAAHEGGHWLGLFHTSEQTGDAWDSISDTLTCDCGICCASGGCIGTAANCGKGSTPTIIPATVCRSNTNASCGGGDNLMFWQYDSASVGTLSAQQGQVMRANAVVR
jgi:hypothetical protein